MYFSNSQASRDLPIPATPITFTRLARRSSRRGVEHLLEQAELAVAAHERRFQADRAALALACRDDPRRLPELHRLGLALQLVAAGVGVHDGRLAGATGGLADEHGAGLGGGLDAGGGVDEVAGDHALVGGAEGDGCFAGEHAGAGLEGGVEGGDRVDEVEGGADGALGVVLGGGGSAPDGHHGVADELLDGAAVALDDRAAGVEVAGQELAGVLGVAALARRS